MRRLTSFLLAFFVFGIFSPARAHYLYVNPIGEQTAAVGEQVGVEVYLHATDDDGLSFYVLNLGFDDAALDGSELTYGSIDYGDDGMIAFSPYSMSYEEGASSKYSGESVLEYIGRDAPIEGSTLPIYAGENKLLFTACFTVTGGDWDGEEDVRL
jgi:hypothetical protein